ncbi:lamprin 1.8-10-like [Homarus americanus]|uniref:lamprin 1.8-10-like n=1 Tax=Homarus americanus TaxID=6706 RepID=UPI001C44FBF6|nr:lamprin 1.8-10-like [Homarus americanus]
MMKLVVLALALTAASAGTIYSAGLPYAGLPYSGLPYSGLPYAGLPYAGLPYAGLPLTGAQPYSGLPVAHASPVTYAAAAAPALVAPAPYSVHTQNKVEVAVEPVENHGYVIKY